MADSKSNYSYSGKIFGLPDLAMILACFLWGLGSVINKNALGDSPESFRAFVYNGIRMPAAAVLMLLAAKFKGGSIRIKREHWGYFFIISFFGIFLHFVLSMYGLTFTSASNMGLIFATVPFFVLILSFATGIEKPTGVLIAGIMIGMAGVAVMSFDGAGISLNRGDVFVLVSCFFWAVYTVLGKSVLAHYSVWTTSAWIFLLSSIYNIPFILYQIPDQDWKKISPENWLNLLFGIVFALFVSNILYYYSIKKIGPIRSGLYTNLEPVFTLILAGIIRSEEITLEKVAGLALIFVGIGVTKIPGFKK